MAIPIHYVPAPLPDTPVLQQSSLPAITALQQPTPVLAPVSAPPPAQNLDVIIAKDQEQGEAPTQAVQVPAPPRSGPAPGQGLLHGPALFPQDIFPQVTLQPAPQLSHVVHSAPASHRVLSPAHSALTPAHRMLSLSHRVPPPPHKVLHPVTDITNPVHPVNRIE